MSVGRSEPDAPPLGETGDRATAGQARDAATDVSMGIGGVSGRLTLHHAPPDFVVRLRQRYAVFLLPDAEPVRPSFSVQLSMRTHTWKGADRTPTVRTEGGHIEIEQSDLRVSLAPTPGGGHEGHGHCEDADFVFETLLRLLWSIFLPAVGGGLFHACGFRDGERGVLAPGQSGAGKTTLARKVSNPDHVFSDELVAVHRSSPHGGWRISGTPFHGALNRGGVSPQSYPLGGIAFLEKHDVVGTRALALAPAVARTIACLLCFQHDAATVQQNLALIIDLCAAVPTFVCGTRLESTFAEVLAALRPRLAGTSPRPMSTVSTMSPMSKGELDGRTR